MKTSRLKNIIILTLILLNAFLSALLFSERLETRRTYERSVEQLQALFAASAITLEPSVLDSDGTQPLCSLTRDTSAEAAFAADLLGAVSQSESGGVSRYENAAGICQFRPNGTMEASFTDSFISDPLTWCKQLLSAYGYAIPADHYDRALETVESGSGTIVGVRSAEDTFVYNAALTFVFSGNRLTAVHGTFLSTITAGDEASGIDKISALVNFLDYYNAGGLVCTRVDRLQNGYLLQGSATSQLKLVSVWRVTTDVSSYYVDFATGEVTRS